MGLDFAEHKLNFLLSRIVGDVTFTRARFEVPDGDHAAEAIADLEKLWQRQTATVVVEAHSDAALRLGRRYGVTAATERLLLVHYSDLALLADELAGYGPEVVVLEPESLKQAVISRLESTEFVHRDSERKRGSAA